MAMNLKLYLTGALYYAEPGDPIRDAFRDDITEDELDKLVEIELISQGFKKVEE